MSANLTTTVFESNPGLMVAMLEAEAREEIAGFHEYRGHATYGICAGECDIHGV